MEFTQVELENESGTLVPISQQDIGRCVEVVSKGENCVFSLVEVVYVTEQKISEINTEHLGKTYVTDIITFDYTDEDSETIEGTLFCCAPRIAEQAAEFSEPVEKEFKRIVIHGLLHLCGYLDDTDELKKAMSVKEDYYLSLL